MNTYRLKSSEIEDLEDLLIMLEENYQIGLDNDDLNHVSSFDELIDYIISKIDKVGDDKCTGLFAFYQLKKLLINLGVPNAEKMTPSTTLEDVFPKKDRRNIVRNIENELSYKFNMLKPDQIVSTLLIILFLASILSIYFSLLIGVSGIILSVLLIRAAYKYGEELKYKTVRELIDNTLCENYLAIRRKHDSINPIELKKMLTAWFASSLGIDEGKLKLVEF